MAAKKKPKLSFIENFVLSGVAAVISRSAVCPLDNAKILITFQSEMLKQGIITKPYNSVIDCIVQTFKRAGPFPLWRGNVSSCIRYFPIQSLNFAFKN
ncbi:unnamed protein product [Adineta steineri]|uniref:ADP/ATP translocase n=1 Tax=Adineta steineri TaxID=433720 RepID=A0A815RW81_9BILA|nr:unnamed protein product [Adineta steineri]CAF4193691.1 unnamed protein product [Adineta steineri]